MNNGRNLAITAAIAGALLAPLAIAAQSARADELSDLRANQELLQRRVDQLAQARVPGNMFGVGGPPGPINVPMHGGSFPRSFLIPGTDTSIRVGGEVRENVLYWLNGGNPHGAHNTNPGTTGQVNTLPLSHSGAPAAVGHGVFEQSPQQSKINVETRTPTAWGEARTFIEFDFANNPSGSSRLFAVSDSISDRLRYAYGTLGGFLAGQANSNFSDSDAGAETLSFSGMAGDPGHARIPQLRYTAPLAGWGIPGALSVSAEQPETDWFSPGTGQTGDSAGGVGNTNPLKASAPDLTAAWYIPQPWGHMDFSAVVRPAMQVKNGINIDRTFVGYGLHFSGDVKPGWLGWKTDDITFQVAGGDGIGPYMNIGSTNSGVSLVSNFTAALATATPAAVIIKPVRAFGGSASYKHIWRPDLRSNIAFGFYHEDINGLNGAVCGVTNPTRANPANGSGCALNKEIVTAAANLIWSPVAFVDVGVEYFFGHRFTIANERGDENVVLGRFRVRF